MTADLTPWDARQASDVTVLDLLDRVLDKGVVLTGDIVLAVAGIDLVYLGVRAFLTSVEAACQRRDGPGERGL